MTSKCSKKKQNTPGLGKEYEVYVPAYFALILNSCEEVEDYTFRSNAKGFGNLDDLVIDVKTKDEELHFGFQLKHKENENNLLPTNFEADKGDFSLEKYCQSFKTLHDDQKKYHFLLYTNKGFDPNKTQDLNKFIMSEDDGGKAKQFFDTSASGKVYKFRTRQDDNNYDQFFSHFTLYPGQKNYLQLEEEILKILNYEEQFSRYMEFFRNWHRGNFTNNILDKKTLNILILDIFVSSFIVKHWLVENVENLELLEQAIQEFDVTILKSQDIILIKKEEEEDLSKCFHKDFPNYAKHQLESYATGYKMNVKDVLNQPERTKECLTRLAKDFKFITANKKCLNSNDVLKLLYYVFGKPLVLAFNENSKGLICKGIKLCNIRNSKIKLVVMGKDIEEKQFPKMRFFSNLQLLQNDNYTLFEEIIKKCFVSLQGRNDISIKKLMENFEGIPEVIEPTKLVQMLQKKCLVGENKEILPSYYVNRDVSTFCLDKELILQHCLETTDLIIIYYEKTESEIFSLQKEVEVLEIQNYFKDLQPLEKGTILLTTEECHNNVFEKVCENNPTANVHYLKMVNKDVFLLTISNNNTFVCRRSTLKKIFIKENSIFDYFNNPINIISSGPGSGKSTFLKSLKNHSPPEWWVLNLDLTSFHDTLFKKDLSSTDFLENVTQKNEKFSDKLKDSCLKKRKIIIFMDSLDELEIENVEIVVQHTMNLSRMGYKIWLFTRQNLREILEQEFSLFMINIEDLNNEQQEEFIKRRLGEKYKEEVIEEIARNIFKNVDMVEGRNVLGSPLQLHTVTEIFVDDSEKEKNLSNNNFLILSNMYRTLFEGICRHFVNKSKPQYDHVLMDPFDQLKKYKIAASETLFGKKFLNQLKIDFLLEENNQFLENIRKSKDCLGIIAYVDDRNRAVFEHFTFAAYFACLFLLEKLEIVRILKTQFFSKQYQVLSTFLNIMLAEKSTLHLALIYKDVNLFQKLLENEGDCRLDDGGRDVFHLLAYMGTKHSVRGIHEMDLDLLTEADSFFIPEESIFIKQVSEILFQQTKRRRLYRDKIFQLSPLEYAFFSGSLYVADKILNKFNEAENLDYLLQTGYDLLDIFYYSVKFGYLNLLSAVIHNIHFLALGSSFSINHSIFKLSVLSKSTKQMDVIKFLISQKNNIFGLEIKDDKIILNTFLYHAVQVGNIVLTKLLLKEGADVEWTTVYCKPLLSFAKTTEMVKLLIDTGEGMSINENEIEGNNVTQKSLLKAAASGNMKLVKLLLDRGVDINSKNGNGETPLHLAIIHQHFSLVELLVEKGADTGLVTDNGDNMFHYCLYYYRMDSSSPIFDLLLKRANHLLSLANNEGATPFHWAVYKCLIAVVEKIFNEKLNLEEIDVYNEKYPLQLATENGKLQKNKVFKLMGVIETVQQKIGSRS